MNVRDVFDNGFSTVGATESESGAILLKLRFTVGRSKFMWKTSRYLLGFAAIAVSLWIVRNAIDQIPGVYPNETLQEALTWLILGRPVPGSQLCPASIHDKYQAKGPDGRLYPTWHPPLDPQTGCYFDHEHGSDPQSFVGSGWSGMPAFGYTAMQAGLAELHAGYKVAVANDDLHGHAWMIIYNQDTSSPQRVYAQFHSVDWAISDSSGKKLVDIHQIADFGYAFDRCNGDVFPGSYDRARSSKSIGQRRGVVTIGCAKIGSTESWTASININDVFKARPSFEVYNPITAFDPVDPQAIYLMCGYYDLEIGCKKGDPWPWKGNQRGIIYPGQSVNNSNLETFFTDPYGQQVEPGVAGAIQQFVTRQGWDTSENRTKDAVFRIQIYSEGVFIAAPIGPKDFAEFYLAGW